MEIEKRKIPKEFDVKIKDKTPDGYMKMYFAAIVAGASRSGKTTAICHIVDKVAKAYKTVVVFSPSISDPTWTSLRNHDNIYFSELVSNHVLINLFTKQKKLHDADKDNSLLIVVDNYGLLARDRGNDIHKLQKEELILSGIKQSLDLLFSRGRHFLTSILASFHDTLQASPIQRINATHWLLYRLNDKCYEKIAPELKCHLADKEFIKLAHDATAEPYSFLYIDLKAHKNEDVFKWGTPEEKLV
ncbi:hypothetical protein PhCBS80983_g06329 [Powellomyces hirtus]|uniref:Uncharacterized protein n=1 Tax=Powellomyces hirtus TaxID=109895 RepID=A0A507DQZ4_9FUNG|nr:hypothetical protein PhCBS80983_g06329 [Powellomyces hirtus]